MDKFCSILSNVTGVGEEYEVSTAHRQDMRTKSVTKLSKLTYLLKQCPLQSTNPYEWEAGF